MNPNEHNSRRAIRFSFIGVFVVVTGMLVAIYSREIREHLGLLRDTTNASQASVGEPSLFNITDRSEATTLAESESGIELPRPYDLREPEFDLTKDQSDVCPLHNVRMTPKLIELCFSWDARSVAEFEKRKNAEFPFAYAISHGTYLSLIDSPIPLEPQKHLWSFCGTPYLNGPPPREARMLVCFQCLAAYESAVRAFNAKVTATFAARRAEEAARVAPK